MLKRKSSPYIAGRPQGQWYKWKRDPLLVDAVLMYAQRGSGKRSSFYSDYTFGLWRDGELLPVGKAYFGFTDQELRQLDRWVRNNTMNRFGPVREVEKALVFEVAFDSVHASTRHKSGVAMRFPRVHRIRWDKPCREAAKRKMLVDFHGGQIQVTMTRTWPNMISGEGVRGMEWSKWSADSEPKHNVTLPFTRMFLGPMDYTPGAMRNATSSPGSAGMANP